MPIPARELSQLKIQMENRRQVLLEELSRQFKDSDDKSLAELVGKVRDASDESVASLLADLNAVHMETEARELSDIAGALLRMRTGTYGNCLDCGTEINLERLKIYPTAKRCIQCQTAHEDSRSQKDTTPSL
ncbi:MAG: TraR/DksA family transcriptional regulator [Gammaproteobacteria bacterium]|nr:TraR/DksA family transcriptional regulator [Gammaproteobacteria bacterium]